MASSTLHDFEQAPGDSEEQGSLACYSLRGRKELDSTERLKSNNYNYMCDYWQCEVSRTQTLAV